MHFLGPLPPRELNATDIRPTSILLSWFTDETNSIAPYVTEYHVQIFKNGVSEKVEVQVYENNAYAEKDVYSLEPNTRYVVEITAHTMDPNTYSDPISIHVTTSK